MGRYQVGKGGVVKDAERIREVLDDIREFGGTCGLRAVDTVEAPREQRKKEQGVFHTMGTLKPPPPVQFFSSIIFSDPGILKGVEEGLAGIVGPIREKTEVMPFSESDYYEAEMGAGLLRYFVLFEPLLDRDKLAAVKARVERDRGGRIIGREAAGERGPWIYRP